MSKLYESKKSHKQEEMAYALFMIIGSCFKKCYNLSDRMESRLFLYYAEVGREKQFRMEEGVIRETERSLAEYMELFEKSHCTAVIEKSGANICLSFSTGFEIVTASVEPSGKYAIEVEI